MTPLQFANILRGAHKQYPALYQLLAAYFHQDCLLDDPDDVAVIDRFAREATVNHLAQTRHELGEVLNLPISEEQLEALVAQLLCFHYPDGGLFREWLKQVDEQLKDLASKREQAGSV